jgi:hypothetical protein
MKQLLAALSLIVVAPAMASAQNSESRYLPQGYVYVGEGSVHSRANGTQGITQTGAGAEFLLVKGFGINGEAGVIGRSQHGDGIFSIDPSYRFRRYSRLVPFVEAGYSRTFGRNDTIPQTNLINFGGGVNYWVFRRAALRLEFRDHFHSSLTDAYAYGSERHYWDFRVGLAFR